MEKKMHKALIIGATGLIGQKIIELLAAHSAYSEIYAFSRQSLTMKHPKVINVIVNFDRLSDYKEYFVDCDVYCCLGTTMKQAKSKEAFARVDYDYVVGAAILSETARQFLVISALGASENSPFYYSRIKGKMERTVVELSLRSVHIFQPSLLLGERQERRLGESLAAKVSDAFFKVFPDSFPSYRPVTDREVAIAMIRCALADKPGRFLHSSAKIRQLANDYHK